MSTAVQAKNYWIQNPTFDLTYLGFGWIIVFLAFVAFKQYTGALVIMVLVFSFVHRHYTFALVYGQKDEFEKRKKSYILLPVAFLLLTAVSLLLGFFTILLAISVVWTMYHTIAQKYGFTRIYSRKAGYGKAWIDKGIIYSWFVYLFLSLGETNRDTLAQYKIGRSLLDTIGNYLPIFTFVSYVALGVAVFFTIAYAVEELRNSDKLSVPKNLFVFSILILYSIFLYDLVIGFVVFGFSHALEYIAFVNVFVNAKYKKKPENTSLFSKVSRRQWVYSGAFTLVLAGISFAGVNINESALGIYITGSSFLHFIYDGWIWKVSRPEVGKPLDIKYAPTT
ncbi:MAG: hypothetical protein RIG61_04990 [Deltaproteobacteria bacterium]